MTRVTRVTRMTRVTRLAARGFTLLELVLGATLVLIISAVAMGVMVSVQAVQRDAQAKTVITRDAQLTLDTVARDLQYLGAGVPRGAELYVPGGNMLMRPPIRIARADYIAFVGDLPYPNADVNGMAVLQNIGNPNDPTPAIPDSAATRHHLHVSSELALCAPPDVAPTTGSYTCRTGQHRLIEVGVPAPPDCEFANRLTSPTCPWSLGKWQATDGTADPFPVELIISNPLGMWVRRKAIDFDNATFRDAVSVELDTSYPNDSTGAAGPTNGDMQALDFVQRRSGASLIAQIDRVFYSLEKLDGTACAGTADCVLRRRQCWGWGDADLDPTDGDFPDISNAPIRSGDPLTSVDNCVPPNEGTDWEPIMHGIKSMQLQYFEKAAAVDVVVNPSPWDADKSEDVMFIQIDVELERQLPSAAPGAPPTKLSQKFTRRVFLENGGGAFVDRAAPFLKPGETLPGQPGPAPPRTNDISNGGGGCETPLTCGRP